MPHLQGLPRSRAAVRALGPLVGVVSLVATGLPARAEVPDALSLAKEMGLSESDIAKVRAGDMVSGTAPASNERELVATLFFVVKGATPGELVKLGEGGLLDKVDPNTVASHEFTGAPALADFARLGLDADRARAYRAARPGSDLNLSQQELASFSALGPGAGVPAVEATVRKALLARLQAYQVGGLAGIAPYARGDGRQRAVAGDLRSATRSLKKLEKYVPAAYDMLLQYPKSKAPGTQEAFRWQQISAHGVPTIVLVQNLYVPDRDAWVVAQRQFYVSTGYNCEQAIAAFLPVKTGTAVFYVNRTSTDQVTGFGGGAKRSLGSRVLASSLEDLFQKARARAQP